MVGAFEPAPEDAPIEAPAPKSSTVAPLSGICCSRKSGNPLAIMCGDLRLSSQAANDSVANLWCVGGKG